MADTKVSAMTNASALAGGEEFHVVQSTNDRAASIDQVKTYVTTTPLAVVGNATAGAELRLPEDTDNGSNYIALKAPDTIASNITYTLPGTVTNGYYLQTDGSGTLSWAAGGGASAPLTLASGTLTDPSTALTITQTWNDAADTFTAALVNVTNTNSDSASKLLDLQVGGSTRFNVQLTNVTVSNTNGVLSLVAGGNTKFQSYYDGSANQLAASSDMSFGWTSGTSVSGAIDTRLTRVGAGVIGVRSSNTTTGGALNFLEQTAPSAPSANEVVVYAEDNGSGKTRLMARFNTGAAQVLATEP